MNALQACHRAHRAWLATSPQLTLPGFWDDGLNEQQGHGGDGPLFVEPASASPLHRGGLTAGAEPGYGQAEGLTASSPAVAAHRDGWASAPFSFEGPRRIFTQEERGRGQKGA